MAPKPSPAADSSALVREYLAQSKRGRRLAGRVAIVTGAGSLQGIGRSAVIALAEAGCRAVFAVDIRSEDDFASLKAECAPFDARLICVVADASEESDVRGLCERAVTEFGRLDIFYANAGISSSEYLIDQVTPENFMHILKVNLLSVALAAKHASKAMRVTSVEKPEPRGSLILTASVASLGGLGMGSGPAYGSSKAGVANLAKSLSWQLGRHNIRINAINPGLVQTSINVSAFSRSAALGQLPGLAYTNALKRHAIPEELANVVVFLASDDSTYVTGQAINVDGGWSASLPVPIEVPKL